MAWLRTTSSLEVREAKGTPTRSTGRRPSNHGGILYVAGVLLRESRRGASALPDYPREVPMTQNRESARNRRARAKEPRVNTGRGNRRRKRSLGLHEFAGSHGCTRKTVWEGPVFARRRDTWPHLLSLRPRLQLVDNARAVVESDVDIVLVITAPDTHAKSAASPSRSRQACGCRKANGLAALPTRRRSCGSRRNGS